MFRSLTQARTYFWRRPSLAFAVVCTLAAGVGLTTAVFSIVDAVLLRPLPWRAAHELVRVYGTNPERQDQRTWDRQPLRWQEFQALAQVPGFGRAGAWLDSPSPLVLGPERNNLIRAIKVSSGFLPALGVVPSQGRGFSADDDADVTGTVIISHEAWQSRFGGRPDILGLEIVVGDLVSEAHQSRRVVGVLPPGFRFPLTRFTQVIDEPPALLLPIEFSKEKWSPGYDVLVRLGPNVGLEAASEAAASTVAGVRSPLGSPSARVVGLAESSPARARPLWILFGGAGLLLLVASSNVAGVLLSQANARQQEMATRRALGAGAGMILRQLGVEHLLLGLAAAAVGLLIAWQLTPLLVALAPAQLPGADGAEISIRVAAFAVMVAIVTSVTFGTVPTLALMRVSPVNALTQGGRGATAAHRRWHRCIVSGEVALAVVLLVAVGLFAETVVRLNAQPLGFEASGLVTVSTLSTTGRDSASPGPSVEAAVRNLEGVPGVRAVAASSALPFLGEPVGVGLRLAGGADELRVLQAVVTDRYFETMGTPVLKGQGLSGAAAGSGRAVISASFERRHLGGDGLGQMLFMSDGRQLQVVGVVPDIKRYHLADDERPTLYALDGPMGGVVQFAVRTSGDLPVVMSQLRDAVTHGTGLAVTASTTMDTVLARSMAAERFRALLGSVFAVSALLLVAIGLYGLSARMVAERRRELSVRIALGAPPSSIRRLVLRDGLTTAGIGLAAGLPAAAMATAAIRSLLFGVDGVALHAYGLVVLVLALTALAATWIPATMASRTAPAAMLRGE